MTRRTEKLARSSQNSLGDVLRVADAVEEHSPAGAAGRSTNNGVLQAPLHVDPRSFHVRRRKRSRRIALFMNALL
jgi:hypothetical protein